MDLSRRPITPYKVYVINKVNVEPNEFEKNRSGVWEVSGRFLVGFWQVSGRSMGGFHDISDLRSSLDESQEEGIIAVTSYQ